MKASILLLVTFFVYASAVPALISDDNEDAHLNVMELIKKYGYPAEEHFVTTVDGYILALHRIPYGKKSDKRNGKVVFLMHGLLCSSDDWIITGVNNGLGYILADEGYNVWMGNARGNQHSRNHTKMNPDKDPEFWKFSWHQIGTTDVPAMIDYVLNATNQQQLYHVGHSQGTTSFYVMTSMRPEYNAKIKAHFSLSPIAFMNHMTSPLMHIMAYFSGPADALYDLIGINEFLPSNDFMAMIGDVLCSDGDVTQILCSNALFVICGFSPKEMNASILPVLMGHTPAGSSVKQFLHYGQEIVSGAFRQYDFGLGNWDVYGQSYPPEYDFNAITAPIYLLYSHNDWLAGEIDVVKLCDRLGTACKGKFLISDDAFNHLDYLYGISAPEVVYNKLISLMARHKVIS